MRSERGQATVEWAGLLLLVALALLAASHLVPRADGKQLGKNLLGAQTRTERGAPVRAAVGAPVAAALPRAGRAAGAVWRSAWFGCLVYERFRYARRHPESRLPGYTFPPGVAARIVSRCVSPVDLLRDVPELDPGS
jgi:Flp pilus assembly pilin Flp